VALFPALAMDRPAVMHCDGRLLACPPHGAHRPRASRTRGSPIGEGRCLCIVERGAGNALLPTLLIGSAAHPHSLPEVTPPIGTVF